MTRPLLFVAGLAFATGAELHANTLHMLVQLVLGATLVIFSLRGAR
jgi:hypothetical protein